MQTPALSRLHMGQAAQWDSRGSGGARLGSITRQGWRRSSTAGRVHRRQWCDGHGRRGGAPAMLQLPHTAEHGAQRLLAAAGDLVFVDTDDAMPRMVARSSCRQAPQKTEPCSDTGHAACGPSACIVKSEARRCAVAQWQASDKRRYALQLRGPCIAWQQTISVFHKIDFSTCEKQPLEPQICRELVLVST